MKSLYEITGRIEDINTVLVQRQEFEGLSKAARQALGAFGEIEWSNNSQWQSDRAKTAITALREALETLTN